MRYHKERHKQSLQLSLCYAHLESKHIFFCLDVEPLFRQHPSTEAHVIFTTDNLSISVAHLKSKYTSIALLDCVFILLIVGQWSHLFFSVLFPSPRSRKRGKNIWSGNKRGRKCADVLHKDSVTEEWRVFLHKGLWSHTYACRIVRMHGCTIYTRFLFILHSSTHVPHIRAPSQRICYFLLFFSCFPLHTNMIICRHAHPHWHTHTHPHTTLVPMYHGGLPAVYQIYVWVVFSSTGLNILFHFPLSHCLTHKHALNTHTHSI